MNKISILKKVRKAIQLQKGKGARSGICRQLYLINRSADKITRENLHAINDDIDKVTVNIDKLYYALLTDAGDLKRIKFIDKLIKKYGQEDKPRQRVKKSVNVGARTRRVASKIRKAGA